MNRLNLLFILFFLSCSKIYAQELQTGIGATVGISVTFGTKVNRAGIKLGGFYVYENIQISSFWNGFYCFNSFGPDLKRLESQFNFGILAAFGPGMEMNPMDDRMHFSPLVNQTGRMYSIGYVYKLYHDNISTSQATGMMGFSFGRTSFNMENDLLILKGSDKFRTGAFSVLHQYGPYRLGLSTLLWTGSNREKGTKKIPGDKTDYPSEFGYYDLSETRHGRFSHGILVVQAEYAMPYHQSAGFRAGVDSERVRHLIQNKILHDMPLLPSFLGKADNPHFPMLDEQGEPFIYKDGQKVKKSRFFGDISINPADFY